MASEPRVHKLQMIIKLSGMKEIIKAFARRVVETLGSVGIAAFTIIKQLKILTERVLEAMAQIG